jgi:hypothetical protein
MSNFVCEKCGKAILEGKNGEYVTGCRHYPIERPDDDVEEETVVLGMLLGIWD